eukprot:8865175-Karenia_brevis.AAC.1
MRLGPVWTVRDLDLGEDGAVSLCCELTTERPKAPAVLASAVAKTDPLTAGDGRRHRSWLLRRLIGGCLH